MHHRRLRAGTRAGACRAAHAKFADYGLTPVAPQVDFRRLLDKAQEVVYTVDEKKQLLSHLAHAGAEVYADQGPAQFVDAYV
ncbi:MAG: hypothetical protein R6W76_17215 [Caldilinea sp.]